MHHAHVSNKITHITTTTTTTTAAPAQVCHSPLPEVPQQLLQRPVDLVVGGVLEGVLVELRERQR